jgi:hypothetical protein
MLTKEIGVWRNMGNQKITPEKITRPIQLLAAWLVGLIAINGTFLVTATSLVQGGWERSALIIAAIANVPIFLAAFFLLQTRFRAELQEDSFYHQYLNKKTNRVVSVRKKSPQDPQIQAMKIEIKALQEIVEQQNCAKSVNTDNWGKWIVSINDLLSEFHEIRNELKKNQIPLSSIFGSTNANDSKPPVASVVSISWAMDFKAKVKLLRILSKFRLNGYGYFEPDEINTDDVYIGGYGYDKGQDYFPFSQEFKEFIQTDIEKADLEYFEKRNSPDTNLS